MTWFRCEPPLRPPAGQYLLLFSGEIAFDDVVNAPFLMAAPSKYCRRLS